MGFHFIKKQLRYLMKRSKIKKDYVLLTNAPRPSEPVKFSCKKKMGLKKEIRDHVFTSGEAAFKLFKKIIF